jgi:prepilin-type N-terminal cleavage/methylation domain-containing protein
MRNHTGNRGFTLIEALVVLAIVSVLLMLTVPSMMTTLRQSKIRGIAQETAVLMRLARLEAIKRSTCASVRILDATPGQVQRVEATSDPDCDPATPGTRVLATFPLPIGVSFREPGGGEWEASVKGFTDDPNADPPMAFFERNGSIRHPGAFRFGDVPGNYLEVQVAPAATARVELRKWRGPGFLDTDWLASGEGGKAWDWK